MIGKLFKKLRQVWRSNITGRFVSKEYAKAHPDDTTPDTIYQEVK